MTDYVTYAQKNMINPFDPVADPDRHYIWQGLIKVDSEAFIAGDWSSIEKDFDAENFEGVRCFEATNPDKWRLAFPTLEDYRDAWLESSRQFLARRFKGMSHRQAIFARTHLTQIEVSGLRALCHKKFFGDLPLEDGLMLTGSRQTLYRLHKQKGIWRIVGFLGQLPILDDSMPYREEQSR